MHARISQQYIQLLMDKQVVSCIVTHVCCLSTIQCTNYQLIHGSNSSSVGTIYGNNLINTDGPGGD